MEEVPTGRDALGKLPIDQNYISAYANTGGRWLFDSRFITTQMKDYITKIIIIKHLLVLAWAMCHSLLSNHTLLIKDDILHWSFGSEKCYRRTRAQISHYFLRCKEKNYFVSKILFGSLQTTELN